ncbi:MAG: PAS domain S-box protein [Candidatus Zixiibacteriota bacterium]|jgi:PAS domain S-box-containing protein/putative nucleotidyltransferase with HDIG domain
MATDKKRKGGATEELVAARKYIRELEALTREGKRIEEARRESEEQFKNVVQASPMGIHMYELKNGRLIFTGANPAADSILRLDNSEFIGKSIEDAFPPLVETEVPERYRQAAALGTYWHSEQIIYEDDRIEGAFEVSAFQTSPGKMAAMFLDVTKRKRAEEKLRVSEEKYSNLFHRSRDAIIIHDLEGTIIDTNKQASDLFGYSTREFAALRIIDLHPPEGSKASAEAFEAVSRHGAVRFEIDFLKKDGDAFPAEVSASLFDAGRRRVVQGIVRDITERKLAFSRLQKSLYGTLAAISRIVEERDPYTFGHQQRVARLARALAEGMELDPDRVESVYVAAAAHDIGKISIPAEILSTPRVLSETERGFIERHPRVGSDILRNVEFPWPVADIVLQHHERLDGSGYPLGLTGDDILTEARILSVADVVEAMSSHRPYRPRLDEGESLAEIARFSGVLYDPEVVEVCLHLFQEKGYQFE